MNVVKKEDYMETLKKLDHIRAEYEQRTREIDASFFKIFFALLIVFIIMRLI